jgi:hypothetical protein
MLRKQIKAMQSATAQYQDSCKLAEALAIEPPDPWESISDSMRSFGAKDNWTPGKFKYAWHHGASTLFRDTHIVCKLDG